MTAHRAAATRLLPATVRNVIEPWLPVAAIALSLSGIVAARWLAMTRGLDALIVGAAFGLALLALWLVASPRRMAFRIAVRPCRTTAEDRALRLAVAAGIGFGAALVAVAVAGASIGGSPLIPGLSRPAAPFLPWAAITIVVAAAEEGILRGVLFDRFRAAGGLTIAVVATTGLFALIHVPLYGWHVVPLDLAAGLGLAGLRLSTRMVCAPALAHATADLATWFL